MQRWSRSLFTRGMSFRRTFASAASFRVIPNTYKVDEEKLEWYSPSIFYPVRMGQVFQSRYQVVSKFGYGTSATVWLCRDLIANKHVALKVCIRGYPSISREKLAFERLQNMGNSSPLIQKCLAEFVVEGVKQNTFHQCFVYEPLGFNLVTCNNQFEGGKVEVEFFRFFARITLRALDFLHSEAKLIHCDLRRENFLMRPQDYTIFQEVEEREVKQPCPRKMNGGNVVYLTPPPIVPTDHYTPVLCDFGEARPGDSQSPYMDDIQPMDYRAPEVLLNIPFSYPVDIWNAGVLLWHVFQGKSLFHPCTETGEESNLPHLQQMVAVMGTPPASLLKRSDQVVVREKVFDETGLWRLSNVLPIPENYLESRETRLEGEEKIQFLRFIRRFLQWDPEMRPTAFELSSDPWLKGPDSMI